MPRVFRLGWLSINQMAAQARLIETWRALDTESVSHLFKKFESSTRASAHNRLKSTPQNQIKESGFLFPGKRTLRKFLSLKRSCWMACLGINSI